MRDKNELKEIVVRTVRAIERSRMASFAWLRERMPTYRGSWAEWVDYPHRVDRPQLRLDEILLRVYPRSWAAWQRGQWARCWVPSRRPLPASAVRMVADYLERISQNRDLPMDRRVRRELETDAWLCMSTMLAGYGNYETWGVIVKNLNVAMILTELGYAEEWLPRIREAMDGAYRAHQRAQKTGRWGFDGPAAAAIREVLQIHQVQLEAATKAHVLEALTIMNERLAAGEVYSEADAQT